MAARKRAKPALPPDPLYVVTFDDGGTLETWSEGVAHAMASYNAHAVGMYKYVYAGKLPMPKRSNG